VAGRRAARVVDEDVRLGAGRERSGAPGLGRDVAGDRRHLGAGLVADLGGGRLERVLGARRDGDVSTFARERERAGLAEPLARRADERLLAGNTQIHGIPPCLASFLLSRVPRAPSARAAW